MNNQAPVSQANPRDLAAAVLAEPLLEQRRLLLERCPEELLPLVQEYVRIGFAKVKSYRAHIDRRAQSARETPPAAPRREAKNSVIHHTSSAPEFGNQRLAELRALIGGASRGH
ncbi:hypothetical protein [Pseudomonas anguilliseptica]|uniref:Uncharacterized protein n=1 Tax=Pseudomonas anguilliseptica TaxID=53406 RepID=A0A1H4XVN2_PSEAG|nr:hypothetical protein [Pseudomonas anguilliseptica]SED09713.1 hypothetical protein SAMN05421553_2023 [Pseudomonas anguilliseptica]